MYKKFIARGILVLTVICFLFSLSQQVFSQVKMPSPASYNSPAEYAKATGKKITRYKEAPMLADLVKQGKLPPVEKRLPDEPLVIVPVEEVGQYGGTWRRAWLGRADGPGLIG
jgi:peptide/nickel transport system substrate-binding protein